MHYHLSRHPAGGCGTHKAGLLQMGWGLRNVRQRQRVNKAWFPPGFAGTFAGTFVLVLFPFWAYLRTFGPDRFLPRSDICG